MVVSLRLRGLSGVNWVIEKTIRWPFSWNKMVKSRVAECSMRSHLKLAILKGTIEKLIFEMDVFWYQYKAFNFNLVVNDLSDMMKESAWPQHCTACICLSSAIGASNWISVSLNSIGEFKVFTWGQKVLGNCAFSVAKLFNVRNWGLVSAHKWGILWTMHSRLFYVRETSSIHEGIRNL